MLKITVTASLPDLAGLQERNLSETVRKLETAVLDSCEPFVPFHTGRLCASGHPTGSGSRGEITWDADYAAECYTASRTFNHTHHPKACAAWFEAAKAADLPLWIETVRRSLASKPSGASPVAGVPPAVQNNERSGK